MPTTERVETWSAATHADGRITLLHCGRTMCNFAPWDVERAFGAVLAAMPAYVRDVLLQRAMRGGPMDASGNTAWEPVSLKGDE